MINDLDVFFPYLLLICCIFFGCAFYRVIRVGNFCTSISTLAGRFYGRTRTGSSRSQPNLEVPTNLDSEVSETAVEDLLRQNIVSAIIAGREARRLANILATTRGISTEECLQGVRTSRHSSTADAFVFNFEDDDLPPAYEDCVLPQSESEQPKF